MKYVANTITISRIILAIILLCFKPFTMTFNVIYIFCGITDMIDGFIARKTHTESAFGAKLDSIADIVFFSVCLIRILPVMGIKLWLWIWIAVVALVKVINIVSGYACQHQLVLLHTITNKVTGLLLFILPLTISFIDINYAAILVCVIATFAAVQEGHYIRTYKNS